MSETGLKVALQMYGARDTLISLLGPDNDRTIKSFDVHGHTFVACWGHWDFNDRAIAVMKLIDQPIFCLGTTRDGKPRHPLYLKGDSLLVEFR